MSVEQSINLVFGQVVDKDNIDVLKRIQSQLGNDLESKQYKDLLTFGLNSSELSRQFPRLSSTVHIDMVSGDVDESLVIYVTSSRVELKKNSYEITKRVIQIPLLSVKPKGETELAKFSEKFGLSSPSWVIVSRIS